MKKVILVLLIIILTVLFPVKLQPSRAYPVLQKNVRYILVKRVPILKSKMVKATAYNAVQAQTDRTPTICAWGDHEEKTVAAELDYFLPKLCKNGLLVVDDSEHVVKSTNTTITNFLQKSTQHGNRVYCYKEYKECN